MQSKSWGSTARDCLLTRSTIISSQTAMHDWMMAAYMLLDSEGLDDYLRELTDRKGVKAKCEPFPSHSSRLCGLGLKTFSKANSIHKRTAGASLEFKLELPYAKLSAPQAQRLPASSKARAGSHKAHASQGRACSARRRCKPPPVVHVSMHRI